MNLPRTLTLGLLGLAALSLAVTALPTPAAASDTGDVIVGAIIGGLIGAALGDDDNDRCYRDQYRYYDRGPVYVPPGPYGSHWTPRYTPLPGQRYRYSEPPRYAPPRYAPPRYAPPHGPAYGYSNGNAYGHCDDGRPGPGHGHAYGRDNGRDNDHRR